MPRTRLLLADDQDDVIKALKLLLKSEDVAIETASNGPDILRHVKSPGF